METERILDIATKEIINDALNIGCKVIINNIKGEIDYIGEEIIILIDEESKECLIELDKIKRIIVKEKSQNQLIKL